MELYGNLEKVKKVKYYLNVSRLFNLQETNGDSCIALENLIHNRFESDVHTELVVILDH